VRLVDELTTPVAPVVLAGGNCSLASSGDEIALTRGGRRRHASCVVREEHRGLTRRVPGPDDVDVQPVRVRSLAAGGAVEDAFPDEPVESLD